jgi:hypothetical protein
LAARTKRLAYFTGSAKMAVSGKFAIALLRRIHQKSTPTLKSLVGSKIRPSVRFLAFSGLRFLLPPPWVRNCWLQSRPAFAVGAGTPFGQRIGSS